MCFYVYSTNVDHELAIEFMYETITLDKNGKSSVVVDMLIHNLSPDDQKELNIIYPNRFFDSELQPCGHFRDCSHTLRGNSDLSWCYNVAGTTISKKDIPGNNWAKEITVEIPSPLDSRKLLKHTGLQGGAVKLTATPEELDLTEMQFRALHEADHTLFKATFDPPIRHDEKRWVRWLFEGDRASLVGRRLDNGKEGGEKATLKESLSKFKNYIFQNNTLGFYLKKYTNKLQYDYQICGPHDVMKRLITYVGLIITRTECAPDNDGACEELRSDLSTLMRRLDTSVKNSVTCYDYIKISIKLDKMHRLTDIVNFGDIQVAGTFPNYIPIKGILKPVYEWKSGNTITKSHSSETNFSIIFQAKPLFLFYVILPYLAFVLALLNLGLRIWGK